MQQKQKIAFDMSSLMWTCILASVDQEGQKIEHEGRLVQVNSAAYGYENAVNSITASLRMFDATPIDMIMVFEGMNSKSRRLAINPKYKDRGSRPPEAYAAFSEMMDQLKDVFGKLGACSVTQDSAEGDDTLGYLAENMEEDLVIVTGDNDLSVACGTNAYGASISVCIKGVTDGNKYGDWAHKYITVYKALVGDSSDKISGIPGFGVKAFEAFLKEFGEAGLEEMLRLGKLGSLEDLVPQMDNPMIHRLVVGAKDYLESFELARLHPEWVNTAQNPLQFKFGVVKGDVKDERLKHWAEQTKLITAANWEKFKPWALRHIAKRGWAGLDIETSTPDQSDEWLMAQGKEEGAGVDVIGSELTGMSLTFGANMEQTVYISVDHTDTLNVSSEDLRDFVAEISAAGTELVIHNFSFEGTVLFNAWGKHWKDNGFEGFLPNVLDTKLEASYVNENLSMGLKKLSKHYFNYDQVDYTTVTTLQVESEEYVDGELLPVTKSVPHKMRELTAAHVKDYGCDDTIMCSSLHTGFKLFMQLEHTWKVYLEVEIEALYGHTQSFVHGVKCDIGKSRELEALDDATSAAAWITLSKYLIDKGWDGAVPPVYEGEVITPAQVKEAFQIVAGVPLDSRDRLLTKLAAQARKQGHTLFCELLQQGDLEGLTQLVHSKFEARPTFNAGSPKQIGALLYEVMGLPVRVYNKATPVMRKAGIKVGSPKTDELAMSYARQMDATPEQKEVLEALQLIKMVQTRKGLYYSTYPYFVHWKTGRLHSSHNQCATNTRRASSSAPNLQQQPKHQKVEGQPARFREVIIPHKRNAVIISMDFMAQELRVIADYSQDKNMLACFVGDHLKDMHALTGLGIAVRKEPAMGWTYELFMQALEDKSAPVHKFVKECRRLGKLTNFVTEFGAMAPKLAQTLLISEEDAQDYMDAKEDSFPGAVEWKVKVIAEARQVGYVTTKKGARRHLAEFFNGGDKWIASKAERQAVNFKVQSSSAEMTKLAEGRMWRERLEQRFDCEIIGPVHDEVVVSCAISDLEGLIPAMHACMVAQYADMQVPVESSISLGCSFGEQIEVGDKPTTEAIAAGLLEMAAYS
jgi:DNA polymerase I-like protein with 3'-5' exonuclease and polymerase domains/5'-3' exonuclease